jgi:nuclear pore complex protein Nup62
MYRLAERVTGKLDELNGDLGDVIGEINDVGAKLTKAKQGEDPVSLSRSLFPCDAIGMSDTNGNLQIENVVRVLNSHLQQLQGIDVTTSQLQQRVQAAKREARVSGTNGVQGLGSDPAEDFYRSFMSRR